MKRFVLAAMASIALLGFSGCDALGGTSSGTTTPTVTYSDWKIKGSFDGWTEHKLVVSETNSKSISYAYSGLYQDATYPIVYEFVLVNGAGKEYKYGATTQVTPGTAFVLGDSSAAGSTTTNNVKFVAAKDTYTVTVDITTATAPSVNLVGGTAVATALSNAVLLNKLKIKGSQFSQINGAAVTAWTATAGTVSGNTESWDVLVDSKTSDFGFDSLDGFLAKVNIDTAGLAATTSTATTAVELLTTGGTGNNSQLTNMTKDGSVYTLTVTADYTKAVNAGRYKISAALKTLSTKNWAFVAPAKIYLNGDVNTAGWTDTKTHDPVTVTSGKATFTYAATATKTLGFKFYLTDSATWNGMTGISGVETTGTTVAISGSDNIEFAAVSGTTYTITVDFSGTYVSTGKPVVTIK